MKEEIKLALKRIGKTVFIAFQLVVVVSVISVIYGLVTDGKFTISYIFIANFATAALVIAAALVILIIPANMSARIRKSNLIDHTTYKEAYMEEREKKREKSYEILYLGITALLLTGIIELIVYRIIL